MGARNYRDLIVWQKAMDLAEEVFGITALWPKEQLFGLTIQAQRAAVSIASNIAEGQGRNRPAEFLRFLDIAHGSRCELETQLTLACRVRFITESKMNQLLDQTAEIGRLLHGLMRTLRSKMAAA